MFLYLSTNPAHIVPRNRQQGCGKRMREKDAGKGERDGEGALTSPQGRFILQVMWAVAEFERELIRERIKDKLELLKAKGRKLGRPSESAD